MKQEYARRTLTMAGIVAAGFVVAVSSAAAQTAPATTATSATAANKDSGGVLTTSLTKNNKSRNTSTADMVNEAIQRSQMRSERLRTTGKLEQFGSEDPFTFNPAQ
jgi:hypothetical protein